MVKFNTDIENHVKTIVQLNGLPEGEYPCTQHSGWEIKHCCSIVTPATVPFLPVEGGVVQPLKVMLSFSSWFLPPCFCKHHSLLLPDFPYCFSVYLLTFLVNNLTFPFLFLVTFYLINQVFGLQSFLYSGLCGLLCIPLQFHRPSCISCEWVLSNTNRTSVMSRMYI